MISALAMVCVVSMIVDSISLANGLSAMALLFGVVRHSEETSHQREY